MSQKPVDQRRPDETRDAIWAAIRETRGKGAAPNHPFTLRDIWSETRASKDTVREYLTGLCRAGIVGKQTLGSYILVRDNGIEAPRVRRDGSEITQGRGRENIWRTIAILQEFTGRELALASSTAEHQVAVTEAETYCEILAKAGYLAIVVKGRPHHPARYRHLPSKFTGPKPPQVQRVKQLYDPNLKRVVWTEEAGLKTEEAGLKEGVSSDGK